MMLGRDADTDADTVDGYWRSPPPRAASLGLVGRVAVHHREMMPWRRRPSSPEGASRPHRRGRTAVVHRRRPAGPRWRAAVVRMLVMMMRRRVGREAVVLGSVRVKLVRPAARMVLLTTPTPMRRRMAATAVKLRIVVMMPSSLRSGEAIGVPLALHRRRRPTTTSPSAAAIRVHRKALRRRQAVGVRRSGSSGAPAWWSSGRVDAFLRRRRRPARQRHARLGRLQNITGSLSLLLVVSPVVVAADAAAIGGSRLLLGGMRCAARGRRGGGTLSGGPGRRGGVRSPPRRLGDDGRTHRRGRLSAAAVEVLDGGQTAAAGNTSMLRVVPLLLRVRVARVVRWRAVAGIKVVRRRRSPPVRAAGTGTRTATAIPF